MNVYRTTSGGGITALRQMLLRPSFMYGGALLGNQYQVGQLTYMQATNNYGLIQAQERSFACKKRRKLMTYKAIPDWLKKQERDPFDYKLRTPQEVAEDQRLFPPTFEWTSEVSVFPSGDTREHGNTRVDHRDKVAKIRFDIRGFDFAPLQRERFIFLLGPRYRGGHFSKIVCRQYLTYQENYLRALEQLRELYWEALRAPSDCVTMLRNPYRREKLIKKWLGKTKEERKARKSMLKKALEDHEIQVKKDEMEAELEIQRKRDAGRGRRVDIAKRRAKLGFNDKGAKEMEDEDIDRLERQINESKEQLLHAQDRQTKLVRDIYSHGPIDELEQAMAAGETFKKVE